ncbi:MAG: hypothetical protein NT031_20935, partial [Planctomycetota bacterium]|nr:hypothetical protein [Planctomycetota bacterium]
MSDYERWIEAYLDGELGEADRGKLEAWLREDPEHVRIFVRASHSDTATREAVAGLLGKQPACPACAEPGAVRTPWWRGRFAGLAAAVILLNLGGLIWIQYSLTRVAAPTVRVLAVSPTADADQSDRVTMRFDRDLVTADLMGKVEPAGLFELAPAWPGQWAWGGTDTLEYRLEKPLPPGRMFHLRAAGGLAARTGKQLQGEKEFLIRTRALALTKADVTACDNRTATVELTFNQPVDPGELLRHLRATDGKDGTSLGGVLCLTKATAASIVIQIDRPVSEQLKIHLDAELAGATGEMPLSKAVHQDLRVTPKFVMTNLEAQPGGLQGPGEVFVNFSHPVGRQDVQVKVAPAVEGLKVDLGGRYGEYGQRIVRLKGSFEPGKKYTVVVPGTVVDEGGQTLGQACTGQVEIPAMEPDVSFPQKRGTLSMLGAMELDLDVLNVKEVEISSWRLHENNLVAYLSQGHSADEVARMGKEKIVKLDAPKNRPFRVAVSLPGVLEGGCGVYGVSAKPAGHWGGDDAVVVLTDLALTVKKQRGGLLVWVTSLRTAQPVAEATVKALSRNNQVLAA